MEDVNISKFRAQVVRSGSTPASPGFVVSEGQNPVDPSGSGQNHLPVTIATASTGLSITESQVLGGAGTVGQYIRGDGSLADFPATTGGGSSVSYYLNGSVSQGTIGGVAYKEINRTPVFGAGTDISISADGYIASFITDALDPNKLLIPAGNWNLETYFSASSNGGTPSFYVELYKYNGTTFTLIASSSSAPELIAFGTILNPYYSTLAVPETVLALTDRLALRYYVTHSGRTITLHTENNHLCQVITTFTTGLTALNGLTSQVQYLTVGTAGTDFAISSASDTHTFNLPTASATNRGALSSADWTTFNNKTSNLGTVTSVGLSSATSGVTIGSTPITTSGTITLTIATASGSQNGLLSSTDWTTFNNKANSVAGGYLPLSGGTMTGVITTPNGTFGIIVGDDSRLADRNTANTLFIEGVQNTDRGYINFSETSGNALGAINAGDLTWRGNAVVTGTGTTNYLPKFTGASTIGNSIVQDNGSTITVGGSVNLTASTSFPTVGLLNRTSDSTLYIVSPASGFSITDNSLNTIYNGTPTAHNWNISNAVKMKLTSSGRLLIGSPPPTESTFELDVNGTGRFTNTLTPIILRSTNASTMWTEYYYNTSTLSGYIGSGSGLLSGANASDFIVRGEADFVVATGGNNRRLTIASTGAATFSSANQTQNAAFNTTGNVLITSNEGFAINRGGSLSLGGRYFSGNTIIATFGRIHGKKEDSSDGATAGYLSFETTADATATLAERMRINSIGNIGIGTANPSEKLHLNNASGTGNFIRFQDTAGGGVYIGGRSENMELYAGNAEKMRITSGGNVLIGTTTNASGKLQVLGSDSTIIAQLKSSSGMLQIYPYFSAYGGPIIQALDGAASNLVTLRIESSSVTLSSLGTGTVTATSGTLSTVSDSAFKIQDAYIDSAIEKVLNLKPRYFYWNEKSGLPTNKRQLGFYAQEVNEALGEEAANTPQDKNTPWGISDRSIIAMLTKAIQELKQEIDTLKN